MKRIRIFCPAVLLALSGCFAMTLPGPNGPERIYPVAGSMVIDTYNYCAPTLLVYAPHHKVEISFGDHKPVEYPAVFGDNNQNQETVYTALSTGREFLGTAKESFSPDNSSINTIRKWVVGGNDMHIYSNKGADICRQ